MFRHLGLVFNFEPDLILFSVYVFQYLYTFVDFVGFEEAPTLKVSFLTIFLAFTSDAPPYIILARAGHVFLAHEHRTEGHFKSDIEYL